MNIADNFSGQADGTIHGSMYTDGVILYLARGNGRVARFRRAFTGRIRVTYYSADGTLTALVVRGEPFLLMTRAGRVADLLGERITYKDNRHMDEDTTASFVALIDRIAPRRAGGTRDGRAEREPAALTAAG